MRPTARRILLLWFGHAAARRITVVPQPGLQADGAFTVNASVSVPRFDPGPEALKHLRREGYVVIKGVLSPADLVEARRLFWAFVSGAGARRDRPRDWRRMLTPNQYGIVWGLGAGQSRCVVLARTPCCVLGLAKRAAR